MEEAFPDFPRLISREGSSHFVPPTSRAPLTAIPAFWKTVMLLCSSNGHISILKVVPHLVFVAVDTYLLCVVLCFYVSLLFLIIHCCVSSCVSLFLCSHFFNEFFSNQFVLCFVFDGLIILLTVLKKGYSRPSEIMRNAI